jgi:MoaA/NifB/PqqE/SkfB family radical SAM enzyme
MDNEDKCFEILLGYACNAKCRFCSQENSLKSKSFLNIKLGEIITKIFKARKEGYSRIGFTGGEPLLRKDIVQIVKIAKKAGFDYIRIQTNGFLLSDFSFTKKLVEAGVKFFKISIHSHIEEVNDYLMGKKGAFRLADRAIDNINKLQARLSLSVVINKKNYKELKNYVSYFLEKKDVSEFIFVFPVYVANMLKNVKELFVSYEEIEFFLKKAYLYLEKNSMGDYLFLNIPPCFLPDRVDKIIGISRFNSALSSPLGEFDLDENAEEDSVLLSECKKCIYKENCRGINIFYLSVVGNVVINPIQKEKIIKEVIKNKKIFFTTSEKCLLKILNKENSIKTDRIIEMAKDIPLCMDCDNGTNVLNAGEFLIEKKMIERNFLNGDYIWTLKKK